MTVNRSQRPLHERFWSKVVNGPDLDSCWVWTGYINPKGYGYFQTGDRSTNPEPAHRVAWRLYGQPLDSDTFLVNTCGTRACVRPDHHKPRKYKP